MVNFLIKSFQQGGGAQLMFLNSKQSVVQNTTRAFIVSMRPGHDPGSPLTNIRPFGTTTKLFIYINYLKENKK